MPYILSDTKVASHSAKGKYKNAKGNTECVEFVHQTAKTPSTPHWVKGPKVKDLKDGCLPKGTVIATFDDNGDYPTDTKGRHAAIYLSHDDTGITVLDQWNKQGMVQKRVIRYRDEKYKGSRSDDGNTFYVVVGSTTEASGYTEAMKKCAVGESI